MDKWLSSVLSLETQLDSWGRKRSVKKALPLITRLLLIATFIEDSIRGIVQRELQIQFLQYRYHLPFLVSAVFLYSWISTATVASFSILLRWHEDRAALVLVAYVTLQQLLYGKYAPSTHGKWGFLVRNLCLCGSLLIIVASSRMKKGYTLLPGFGKPKNGTTSRFPEYIQLASRCLMALLSLEFVASMGWIGTLLSLPVVLFVFVGFKTQLCSLLLMLLYAIHNVLQSAFWYFRGNSWEAMVQRDVKLFEFVQTLSIMGGLGLLSSSGPGALSFDERKK
ncbi:COPII-coated vesicle protein SurF4/Erv29, putative [Galdieria sulphuraria]|uniref:COPII-coated vesicle protein SurF4/Erv29, putative n=1 Tax=Galdieria sulphuraria TaxID=130081 RepID=M2XSM8_GALSU|nr:COPII-coated vesicle protein SurF4/Erv29, putative [Galdieria sulphuraria]EME26409.1 COPII-coated vesicle protein SurF4/Erv29, putative [Galdieria sulphuraria]|eukprot:XP_005702929.1 COPII-coated vesicle protein SurF4/Erv29, putative [Galdieria sulphuraria]